MIPLRNLAIAFLLSAAHAAFAGEPTGLVSRYPAEGTSTDALGANDGVANGAVNFATGAIGQGFSLSGAGHIDVAAPTFDAYRTGFTVAAWIRIGAYVETASLANLRPAENSGGFTLEQQFGNPGALVFAVNQTGVAEEYQVTAAAGWLTGPLYHVAATFDAPSGTMTLYRNGAPVASRTDLAIRKMAPSPGAHFQIGRNIVNGALWSGIVDDVRFYGRALAAREIAAIVAGRSLVSHWRFDEGGGTTARDETGAFPGTLAGGAKFVAGGVSGTCMSLDRATGSFVNMGASFPAFTSGDFSVVLWVKSPSNAQDSLAVSKHAAFTSNGYLVATSATGGGGAAGRATFYASDPQVAQAPTSATAIDDGAWHQIVGVYRAGGTHTVYVDGAPGEAATASSPVTDQGAPFLVGGVNVTGSPEARYTGLIDELSVYGTALTDADVDYLFHHPGGTAPGPGWDLTTDWSDTANPNGPWIYREGTNALPRVTNWGRDFGEYSSPQGAWARTEVAPSFLPSWIRDAGNYKPAHDWVAGDVVTHATDPANGAGSGVSNVAWISPFAGVVDVSGAVWMGREIGRGNRCTLWLRNTKLFEGDVASGDAFSRGSPLVFSSGTGGAAALRNLLVAPGDEIRLDVERTSQSGDFTGVRLRIDASTSRQTLGTFLASSVKLKLAGAGKDSLTVKGAFDDGGAAVDHTAPFAISAGGYVKEGIAMSANAAGSAFGFKDANFAVSVKPRLKGSSRGTFKFKVSKSTLADLIGPADEIEIRRGVAGSPGARSRVRLTNGAFVLGKVKGTLVLPEAFLVKATAVANESKPDALALLIGIGSFQVDQPLGMPDYIRVAFGGTFDRTIPRSAFTIAGDVWKFSEKTDAASLAITADFAKGLVTVKSKGVEIGALGATTDLLMTFGDGDAPLTQGVRLGGTGPKRTY